MESDCWVVRWDVMVSLSWCCFSIRVDNGSLLFRPLPRALSAGDRVSCGYVCNSYLSVHQVQIIVQDYLHNVVNHMNFFPVKATWSVFSSLYLSLHPSWQYLTAATSPLSFALFFSLFVPRSAENASVAMTTNPKGKSWGWIVSSLSFPSFVSGLVEI